MPQRLAARALPGLAVERRGGDDAALVEAFAGVPRVWLFDAVRSGAAPGTLHSTPPARGRERRLLAVMVDCGRRR